MSWKDSEPDIIQSLRNMRDKLADILTGSLGKKWAVKEKETPAQYANRYLVHRESPAATPATTIPALEARGMSWSADSPVLVDRASVLAHGMRQLYVRYQIEDVVALQETEHRAWRRVIAEMESAIETSQNAMKNRHFIATEANRIPFMARMSALKAELDAQFPHDEDIAKGKDDEDPKEYTRRIAFAAERELHPTFGDADIARMIVDGLPDKGRNREVRLRARRKRHANKTNSEGLQTGKEWVVIIDDQE